MVPPVAKLTDIADVVPVAPRKPPRPARQATPRFTEVEPVSAEETVGPVLVPGGLSIGIDNPFVRSVLAEVIHEIGRLGPALHPPSEGSDRIMPTTQGAATYIRAYVLARTNEKKNRMLIRAAASLIAHAAIREEQKCVSYSSQGQSKPLV